jgi:hypothetical protein
MRLGDSAVLPYSLDGVAKLDVKLSSNPLFADAKVVGNKADFGINFPLILRVGSELRLVKSLRLEGRGRVFVPRRWRPGGVKLVMRGGLAYEKGAFRSNAMTPLTLDSDKVVLTGGFGINLHKRVRFDTLAGSIFMKDMKVRDSNIEQPQAIRPTTSGFGTPLGNGDYNMDAFYLGGGFAVDIN